MLNGSYFLHVGVMREEWSVKNIFPTRSHTDP